ncbi:MAG: phytoene desaturase [Chitinivibrionales bacterium]|nr:phytoene desaturase [Chitinivibrionales bacterium]
MSSQHILIIGAGPGGLTAGMILAKRGYKVTFCEKENTVGGRNTAIQLGSYTFDTGPTFLMMTFILREVFELAGKKLEDYCEVVPLDPMYKLAFADRGIYPTSNHEEMRNRIAEQFPGDQYGYDAFLKKEGFRYKMMYPCLQKPYSNFRSNFSPALLKAIPFLSLNKTLYQNLSDYFTDEELKVAFTFQAKYLGMSPWECPAAFTIIPYIEHAFGIDHIIGGLSRISDAMAAVAMDHGAQIRLNAPVKKIIVANRKARGVELENGEKIEADQVIINADFGYAMTHLFEPGIIRKYAPHRLRKKKFSCSTFMLYLGIDKRYDEPHHQIIFAENYKNNITDIAQRKVLSDDMSIYVRNAGAVDTTIAPDGHSAVYVLVPVPNNKSSIQWNDETIQMEREKVLDRICKRTSMHDLREHIIEEKIITPSDWENDYNLFLGATFNLGHNLTQMLYFRPHNKFEEVDNCYLVGGGTHPGSGLPTIYESGRISANMISGVY